MAVKKFSFFEEHAGKLFLAAVAVVALVLVLLFTFGSGVTVKVDNQDKPLPPAQDALSAKVAELDRLTSAKLPDGKDNPPREAPISLPNGLDKFEPGKSTPMGEATLANVGPNYGKLESTPDAPLVLPLAVLTAPSKPVLTAGLGVGNITQVDAQGKPVTVPTLVRWVAVCTRLPVDGLNAFWADLLQQAGKRSIPNNKPWLVLNVRIQRQRVDDRGQPVGPTEDLPPFRNTPPILAELAKLPYPGEDNSAALEKWVKTMAGPFEQYLTKVQPEVRHPKMYDGITADVQGVEPLAPPGPGEPGMPGPPPGPPPMPPPGVPSAVSPVPSPVAAPVGVSVYTFDEKAEPNTSYRYRIQIVLFNPMLNHAEVKFNPDPKQDQKRLVTLELPPTGWSEWSDPIRTERDQAVFLSGSAGNVLMADVFQLSQNFWFRKEFPVKLGEPLGGPAQAQRSPASGDRTFYKVNFSTGLVPVDIRPNVDIPIRTGRPDAPELGAVRTWQVIFADAQGRLHVRTLNTDLRDPDYDKMRKRIAEQDKPPAAPPTAPVAAPAAVVP